MIVLIEDIIPKLPTSKNIKLFTDYILKIIIVPDCVYPLNIWAKFSATSNHTMKNCESFHAKLNSLFCTSHQNIYYIFLCCCNF